MNLIQHVADMVHELDREVTGDELLPYFPRFTRAQVFHALKNAKYTKKIRIVRRGRARGKGRGSDPGIYAPLEEHERPIAIQIPAGPRPVNSVWELGARV